MTLSEKQAIFTLNIAMLVIWVNCQPNMRCRLREVTRTSEQQVIYFEAGRSLTMASQHRKSLAADIILDRFLLCADDKRRWYYQTKYISYEPLGEFWKKLHPDNIWGGDWVNFRDGNHVAMKG